MMSDPALWLCAPELSTLLYHPAFQSLVLPFLLSLLAVAALWVRPGARWAPLGAALGLIGALAWLPGFDWPAASRVQKLPWIVLAGLALAVAAMALHRTGQRPWRVWSVALVCWAGTSVWLVGAQGSMLLTLGIAVAGAVVLGLLASGQLAASAAPAQPGGAVGAGSLTVAALGLAALAGDGGSLLLAQLVLMVATSTAVLGMWVWLRPASGVQAAFAALMPLCLAWLALASSLALSLWSASTTSSSAAAMGDSARLGLLALAFAVPSLLMRSRWAQAHPRWTPLLAALLAALPVAAAVAWQFGAGAAEPPGQADDDPYYTPG